MQKIIIKNTSKSLVHTIIGVKFGWRFEPKGKRGISHFLEHSIFEGNDMYPNPDEETGKYGVVLNGMTLSEYILFNFTSTKDNFNTILKLFLSLIFAPNFDKEKLEKIKTDEIIGAVVSETDFLPWEMAQSYAENLLFNWDILCSLGTEEEISSITIEDIKKFHKNIFHNDNSFILVYGDIDEDNLSKIIDESNIPIHNYYPPLVEINWDKNELFIKKADMNNSEIVYAFEIPQYSTEYEILKILLGNYPISKLSKNEDIYMGSSKTIYTTKGSGFFIYLGVNPNNNIDRLNSTLWNSLENFEITDQELEFAKKIAILEILKMQEEGERGLLKFFLNYPLGYYKDFTEIIEQINKINKKDIYTIVNKIFKKENQYKVIVSG